MPKLEPYSRKLPYSYALGLYPSLSLIDRRPELAQRLLLAPEGLSNDGVEKLRARCREQAEGQRGKYPWVHGHHF